MTTEARSNAAAPVRGQLTLTWATFRRSLLLVALVLTGIISAAVTASRELFAGTASALTAPVGPNSRLRAAIAWPISRAGRVLAPADDAFRRLDAALVRLL